jgi:hypothetical protein
MQISFSWTSDLITLPDSLPLALIADVLRTVSTYAEAHGNRASIATTQEQSYSYVYTYRKGDDNEQEIQGQQAQKFQEEK